jgi:DNA mismatch endonuclease, patch repair protein
MSDVHEPSIRSYNMSQIKGKNTKPELLVRRFLFSQGFRYRIHYKRLPGKPDIVLKKYRTIIFVHGCFWHGHEGCKYFVIPKTRTNWWMDKIRKNRENDIENRKKLTNLGWKVVWIFECELKTDNMTDNLDKIVYDLLNLSPIN